MKIKTESIGSLVDTSNVPSNGDIYFDTEKECFFCYHYGEWIRSIKAVIHFENGTDCEINW